MNLNRQTPHFHLLTATLLAMAIIGCQTTPPPSKVAQNPKVFPTVEIASHSTEQGRSISFKEGQLLEMLPKPRMDNLLECDVRIGMQASEKNGKTEFGVWLTETCKFELLFNGQMTPLKSHVQMLANGKVIHESPLELSGSGVGGNEISLNFYIPIAKPVFEKLAASADAAIAFLYRDSTGATSEVRSGKLTPNVQEAMRRILSEVK